MRQIVEAEADHVATFERHEINQQLHRIVESAGLRSSPVLQALLRFVVTKALDGRDDALTEQSIAKEVFSRDSTFDCSVDTVVRTHAYRLRQKLKEYYSGPGLSDAIFVEIPKGHYRVRFSRREESACLNTDTQATEVQAPPIEPVPVEKAGAPKARVLGRLVAALVLLIFGIWIGRETPLTRTGPFPAESSPGQTEMNRFWNEFLGPDRSPIIAYSNDLYLTTAAGNLLMFSGPTADRGTIASRDAARRGVPGFDSVHNTGPLYFEDDKTDVGEVVSASVLTAQFVRMGLQPTVKRGRVITTYDLESHNVIFLGSPFANKILNQIEGNANFVFRDATKAPSVWGGAIHNLHPQAGEASVYELERDPNSQALRADYAVIASVPGISAARKVLVLGGLTTSGTQAAAQFVTSPAGLAALQNKNGKQTGKQWPSHFEYLLRVTLDRGLDVLRSECLASRTHADAGGQQ